MECILYALLQIYFLSIWNILEVYEHSRIHDIGTQSVNLMNTMKTTDLLENTLILKHLQKTKKAEFFSKETHSLIQNGFADNYRQIISRDVDNLFINRFDEQDASFKQELVSDSMVRIMFVYRDNLHAFGDLLIMCFSVLVFIKLVSVDKISRLLADGDAESEDLTSGQFSIQTV